MVGDAPEAVLLLLQALELLLLLGGGALEAT